jgi:hypothetical protein
MFRAFMLPPKLLVKYAFVLEIRPGTGVGFLSFAGLPANQSRKERRSPIFCKAILLLLRPFYGEKPLP